MEPVASPLKDWSLHDLIEPVPVAGFFCDHFESKPLYVGRRDPTHFGDLVSREDIDQIVARADTSHCQIKLARAGFVLTPESYSRDDGTLDPCQISALVAGGATLVLNGVDDLLSRISGLCRNLEAQFSAHCQTNLYLTPPNDFGFGPHFDTHDVFVLQTHGHKVWNLFKAAVELPMIEHSREIADPGPPLAEIELYSGDTLYIPRGYAHAAMSRDETSIHLTVGILPYTWTDLIFEVVAHASLEDPAYRGALPTGFAREGFGRAEIARKLRNLIGRLTDVVAVDVALDALQAEHRRARHPEQPEEISRLSRFELLSIDSLTSPRSDLTVLVRREATGITITCGDRRVSVPDLGAEAARAALATQMLRVGDMPGRLDDESRLALARRLVREGLLVVEPSLATQVLPD